MNFWFVATLSLSAVGKFVCGVLFAYYALDILTTYYNAKATGTSVKEDPIREPLIGAAFILLKTVAAILACVIVFVSAQAAINLILMLITLPFSALDWVAVKTFIGIDVSTLDGRTTLTENSLENPDILMLFDFLFAGKLLTLLGILVGCELARRKVDIWARIRDLKKH